MKRRTFIRLTVTVGSLCLSAWQLPGILDRIEKATAGVPGAEGGGGAAAILQMLRGGPAPAAAAQKEPAPPSADDFRIFSPDGRVLSEAERKSLLEQAARQAPLKPGSTITVKGGEDAGGDGGPEAPQSAEDVEKMVREALEQLNKPTGG